MNLVAIRIGKMLAPALPSASAPIHHRSRGTFEYATTPLGTSAFARLLGPALLLAFSTYAPAAEPDSVVPAQFDSSVHSLQQYKCPDWFRDAKFGIWSHWGPQCVPEEGDWYARNLYIQGERQAEAHRAKYGHPSKFGYKDVVALWKAEHFDPDRLMALYRRAGAKYFVSMGVHHDNFDLWNSTHHRWNAVQMGPKKDIVGLWAAAARKEGLRFGVSEHLERSYSWFNTNKGADKQGPLAGVPYDGNDPQFADFYFPPHDDTSRNYPSNPPDWWPRQWAARITDLIDNYQPDLLYTDGGIPFGEIGRSVVAHFYNRNMELHGGKLEAVYNIKDFRKRDTLHGEYHDGIAVEDLERGILLGIKDEPWQTDTSVADWFYRKGYKYKTATDVIHLLADIVSKNGNLLLNFTQHPDGTLDQESEVILAELAEWMPLNGEAIYGTRPWAKFGEGPNVGNTKDRFNESSATRDSRDVRFTTKGGVVYAIVLGWPGGGALYTVNSFTPVALPQGVARVSLLGSSGDLTWRQDDAGLHVTFPAHAPCRHAYVLKIEPPRL